jgi:hypothetical protein
MATTIRSTALDFDNIKSNLKTYLANQEQFKDYNFEAAGLSNILDVLAYNTHINALIANFALNESYLPTAQLRSSMVSLAEGIGYVPDTDTSSQAKVRITFSSTAAGRDVNVTLPAYSKFSTTVDDVSYTFQTIEDYIATDDGTGFYEVKKSDGSNQISVYEGTLRSKTFLVGEYEDNPVYVVPDGTLDADTVTVKVFESATSTTSVSYQNILNATTINANSTVYVLKEAPNGYFELSFGDGSTFGVAPSAGNRIEVQYLSTKGDVANGAAVFTPSPTTIAVGTGLTTNLTVTTQVNSVGGQDKESVESIRQNAPFQYATQNRMVTAADYSSLILRNYSTLISDIVSWGGQDALKPEFGAVYTSILFEDTVSTETQTNTKNAILDLAAQLAVVSFNLRFVDPITTFVEVDTFFQFNPKLTDATINTVKSNVNSTISSYFTANTGKFNQAFRRSNMLTDIDESSAAILSSRATIRMQQRFIPSAPSLVTIVRELTNVALPNDQLNTILELIVERNFIAAANYMIVNNLTNNTSSYIIDTISRAKNNTNQQLLFPVTIAAPDDDQYIISSNEFTFNGQNCIIRNKLSSNVLQVITAAGGNVITDNIGNFDATAGIVTINYFNPTSISRSQAQIKLSAVPANQSVIDPTRNERLVFDPDRSVVTTVLTEATN